MEIPGIRRGEAALETGGARLIYTAHIERKVPESGERTAVQREAGRLIDSFSVDEVLSLAAPAFAGAFRAEKETMLQCGGWQSWSAGWELAPGEKLPRRVLGIPELIKLTNRPRDRPGGGETVGHFIMYLRRGDYYLCIASLEGGGLPPLSFRCDKKRTRIGAEIYCPGKTIHDGETLAVLCVFAVHGYFALKDALNSIYGQDFSSLNFLSVSGGTQDSRPGGYASWYNHYNRIDEKIILGDLEALSSNDNLIKLRYLDRKRPAVFQIDDGWENAVGEWEINAARFPNGLKGIAEKIEETGCIPGLWIAPFLATKRCRVFSEKPHWLLRDKKGRPLSAGFNHLWDGRYYCLDISREDVRAYIKDLIDRVIDQWGFRYLKLDFLYTGLFDGVFEKKGAPHEHYQRACALLTSRTHTEGGLPVAYLGCGLPLGLSYRHFPLSRIGADTREMWEWKLVKALGHVGRPSAYINLMDTIGRSFMNGTLYINDPDVIFLRSRDCALSETEKETIALVNFLLAGQLMFSDDPAFLSPRDLAFTRRISALYDELSGEQYGVRRVDRNVFALFSRSEKYSGLINLGDKNYTLDGTKEGDIFLKLRGGKALIDHRLFQSGLAFAPRSITVVEKEQ
jgi:alpha-galactosidase